MLDFFLKCCLRGICSKQFEGLPFDETSLDSGWVTREEISVLKFFSRLVRCVCAFVNAVLSSKVVAISEISAVNLDMALNAGMAPDT